MLMNKDIPLSYLIAKNYKQNQKAYDKLGKIFITQMTEKG